jgi:hypothetical protein
MLLGSWPVRFCPLRSLQRSAFVSNKADGTARCGAAWPERGAHRLVTLPAHRRSPSAAGTVPTSCSAASDDAEVSVAVKPALVLTPTVDSSDVKRTVRTPPLVVTPVGSAAPEKLCSSGALGDAPSYSLM